MPVFRPFKAVRPLKEYAREIAAKPYDVLNSTEARKEAKGHPLSFLHVNKPEIDLEENINLYDPKVYQKGKENLQKLIDIGYLKKDTNENFYIYSCRMD